MATVRYFAAAQAAAGMPSESVDASTVTDLVSQLTGAHGSTFAAVLRRCSLLVDGRHTPLDADLSLSADTVVDVLPPFAGG